MTLTLFDRTAAITTTVTPSQAIALLAELPVGIQARIRPDPPYPSVPSTVLEPQPPGYFGLAVALARGTYEDCPACGVGAVDAAYAAYLRGELADPRD